MRADQFGPLTIDVPMTMFSRLFRKAPPAAADAEARAVDSQAGSAQAMGVLADGVELRRLAGVGDAAAGAAAAAAAEAQTISAEARRAAQARLATLVDAGEVDVASLMDANRSAALCVVALCVDRGRLAQAFSVVEDPAELASLVMSPSSRVRLAAAQRLQDPTTLRQLLKQVRERDKGVYKVLKEKCDALNAEARRAESQAAEVAALCASLEQHGQRTYDVHYEGAFEGLKRRWDSVTPASEWQERARAAIQRCEQVVAAHLADVRERAAREALLRESQRAVEEADERARRETEQAAAAEALKAAKAREEQAAAQETAARARAEVHEARERRVRRIEELLQGANELLTAGNTKAAAGRRRDIEEQRSAAGEMPAALARQVRALDARLNELKHWKDFAVAPKRRELIAQMQALIGVTEDPSALSKRIKLLQEEWRTMSKGIVSETGHDWEEFQRASQSAYEPCRKYFDEQTALRQENLDKRREVFKRLLAFEAAQGGDAADWRLIANVLREAPREWREHFPVEREAGRVLEKEFEAVMARLTARIDTWAAGNVAEKQGLIRRAQLVASQADGREAADAVKRLQVLWKEVGFAPRDEEQTLWAEFRAACDAVFQKKQQAEDEYRAGLAAHSAAAVTLCEAAERAAQLSGSELSREAQRMAEWRAAFEAIGELPRAEARSLRDRFERAIDTCRRRLQQQKDDDARQAYANLFEAGRRIREVEWATLNGAAAGERQALRQAAESFMAAVPAWPPDGAVVVKERLAKAESAPSTDAPARERALRMLCVRTEILKERATPAEDESLRREYQVQRLVHGMGQGRRVEEGDGRAMVTEWVGIGAIEPRTHEELEVRFRRGLES
jgi:ElaB/YqjD/DUF883 family membrane-anchored ribosome-binding protein